MSYTDEEILEKREEKKKEKYCSLETGIYLDGRIMKFERKELFDTFSVMLPDCMIRMPERYARVKYPSEFRPQLIMTTDDLNANLGFTLFPESQAECEPVEIAERTKAAIHRANPDSKMYPCRKLKKTEGCWFSFRSHAMDSDLYNMTLIMKIEKSLLLGSFNCLYQEYRKWENTTLMIWDSILKVEKKL